MKKIFFTVPTLVIINLFISCTPPQQTTEGERIYVFDEQKNEDKIEVKKDGEFPDISETYYVVQIGAFTTKDRAEKFAELSRTKINRDIIITYSENNNLYLVQLSPFYKSRQEAELIRDELKVIPEFSDVWIVTVNK
uniref:SPOR domain-containing protein n=1 Tax=Ignavibacterium album TaxID=591197 RepID=A0A832DE93_9BACT